MTTPRRLQLDGVLVEQWPHHCRVTLPDGSQVHAGPDGDHEAQLVTARDLGYGDDVERMNREHDTAHALLAWWRGQACSPVLWAVAHGETLDPEAAAQEESDVMALQRALTALSQ